MSTATLHPVRGARRRIARFLALGTAAGIALVASTTAHHTAAPHAVGAADYLDAIARDHERYEELEELEGRVPTHQLYRRDAIEAAFARESYRPGSAGRLIVSTSTVHLRVQILRAGVARVRSRRNDVIAGAPVTRDHHFGAGSPGRAIRLHIGNWPSGLYVARLRSAGRTGFAPFVVRPRRLGAHRVAVVLPTFTWQAYNFRDDDGDGSSDTWYAWHTNQARIARPYLDRGVPPHYRLYDEPFLRWLDGNGRQVDFLTDLDLDALRSGRKLARYELLIFPGHHEYVTRREYDAVTDFRNRGGNLMFLSANNFFWRVDRKGNVLTRVAQWRDLGRPEAALIGAQYIGNDRGTHRGAWHVRRTRATSWLFPGTGSAVGDLFSNGGIEIDARSSASPPHTQVVAEIPNVFGHGLTAQMTYYETARGAKVFAAGAFTLAGAVRQRPVRTLLENLWRRQTNDPDAVGRHYPR
jgi:hypothetical protein